MLGVRVPDPDRAMLVSGGKGGRDGAPFRVVVGNRKFGSVKPAEADADKAQADSEATKLQAEVAASNDRVALERMIIQQLPQFVSNAGSSLAKANGNGNGNGNGTASPPATEGPALPGDQTPAGGASL